MGYSECRDGTILCESIEAPINEVKMVASDGQAMYKEEMRTTSSAGLIIKLGVISHCKPRMIHHGTS